MVPSAAILALFCAPLVLSAPPAAAAPTKLTVATGSITCRKLTGVVTFTPPVHVRLSQRETSAISLHASACTTNNSNVAHVSAGNLTFTTHGTVTGCSGLGQGRALSGIERWQPSSIAPSTVVAEGFARRANKAVSVTGSFGGKASTIEQENLHGSILVYTDRITGQLDAECKSPAGLSVLNIVSGVETLP